MCIVVYVCTAPPTYLTNLCVCVGGGFGGKETRSINLSSAVAVAANKSVRILLRLQILIIIINYYN